MSEENKISRHNNEPEQDGYHHKKHVVLTYFIVPLIFVLISLLIVVPSGKFLFGKAVQTVHKAQEALTISYNDLEATDASVEFTEDDGIVIKPPIAAQRLGTLKCETAGLNAELYYGINRVSLRAGAGVKSGASLFGQDGQVSVYGYASTAFKALKNVKPGDIISVEASWGKYEYSVEDIQLSDAPPKLDDNVLVLSSDADEGAFSGQSKTKRFVIARQISGPRVKEVRQ